MTHLLLTAPKLRWNRATSMASGSLLVVVECEFFALFSTQHVMRFARRCHCGAHWNFIAVHTTIELETLREWLRDRLCESWARDIDAHLVEAFYAHTELALADIEAGIDRGRHRSRRAIAAAMEALS